MGEIHIVQLILHNDPKRLLQSNLIQSVNMYQKLWSSAMVRTLGKVELYSAGKKL